MSAPPPTRTPTFYALASFAVSMAVLATKALAWLWTGSVVLLADAAESGLDVVTASLLVLAVHFSTRPPDEGHPFGHGKAEYFSSGFQGALILAAGVGVAVEAIRRLGVPPVPLELGLGLALSAVATAANVALALTLIRVGRELRSPALAADGRHNLTDVATTAGGWLGLGLAWASGWWVLDPLVALLVAAQILWTGGSLVRAAVAGLMDASIPEAELETLRAALERVLAGHPETSLDRLRARRSSERTFVQCALHVPGAMPVEDSHALCDELEAAAAAALPGSELHVHVEPR